MGKKMMVAFVLCMVFIVGISAESFALWGWGKNEIETEKVAINFAREVERGGYKIVSTAELKGWLDHKKDMLLVDTMPFEEKYKKGHIPGAVNIEFPVAEITNLDDAKKEDFTKLLGEDKNRLIVVYCGFTKCGRSHNGAMWAEKLGYKNVYRYPGGIKAWLEADYPVEKTQ